MSLYLFWQYILAYLLFTYILGQENIGDTLFEESWKICNKILLSWTCLTKNEYLVSHRRLANICYWPTPMSRLCSPTPLVDVGDVMTQLHWSGHIVAILTTELYAQGRSLEVGLSFIAISGLGFCNSDLIACIGTAHPWLLAPRRYLFFFLS